MERCTAICMTVGTCSVAFRRKWPMSTSMSTTPRESHVSELKDENWGGLASPCPKVAPAQAADGSSQIQLCPFSSKTERAEDEAMDT